MGLISRVSSRTYRSSMRTQLCQFSAMKIYPGHGKDFIRYDGKRIVLINGKSERLFRKKKNPRKVTWTVLYRRKHKKGTMTELDLGRGTRGPSRSTEVSVVNLGLRSKLKRTKNLKSGKLKGKPLSPLKKPKRRTPPTKRKPPPRPASLPLPNRPSKRTSNNKSNVSVARGKKKFLFSVSF